MTNVTTGWESVHQRLKKSQSGSAERWRLRDWDRHPNDPGWENGTYTSCHAKLRTDAKSGEVIFDTVYTGRPAGASPIIRSAFVVEDGLNRKLSFSGFWFLDGNGSDGVSAKMSRGEKRLDEGQVENYMAQIEASSAYSYYSTGSKPESIPQELWDEMVSKAGGGSDCSPCGECD